jgi:basic amino acid/polyamine antiporter, APA family
MESVSGEFNNSLKRRIGLLAATLAGIGIILGAGIYVLVGVAAGEAGNAVWISFLIAALAASFTTVSYARLSRLHPKNAPEYQFLSLAFGHTPGFLAGWLILWATTISAATVSLGFDGYLQHLSGLPYLGNAVWLIVLSSLVVFIGVGESALVAGILTVIEITGVVFHYYRCASPRKN